jgi:hypothetical protein
MKMPNDNGILLVLPKDNNGGSYPLNAGSGFGIQNKRNYTIQGFRKCNTSQCVWIGSGGNETYGFGNKNSQYGITHIELRFNSHV